MLRGDMGGSSSAKKGKMTRILLADDHALVRQGVRASLERR